MGVQSSEEHLVAPSLDQLEKDYAHSSEYAILQAICMFVQQMHLYNTLVENLSSSDEEESSSQVGFAPRGGSTSQSNQGSVVINFLQDCEEDAALVEATQESSEIDRQKKLNEAVEKLKKYELRALNLFRDVDLIHIQQLIEC